MDAESAAAPRLRLVTPELDSGRARIHRGGRFEVTHTSHALAKAAEVVVLSARLYRELALSALTLLPGRSVR